MDIKKSFKRFKKNYIRESEALDAEDLFVDVDLEGTNEERYQIDVYYNEDGGFPDFDTELPSETLTYTYDELVAELGQEAADELINNGSYDSGNNTYYKLVEGSSSEETDIEFTDPEENIDAGYDTDFNESCCGGGKKKSKKGKKGKKDKKSKFVPFWAKKKDKELKEALKTLKSAGYSIINESGMEYEDDATGFGIAFDDSDYYTEEGECEVCAICGRESCDGEYDEDGNFVCSDCAENSLEQPMEEIDPMDIYFRAAKADNIRDMNRFVR
jgi:hypothetical protein